MDSIRQIVHALEVGSRASQKAVGLSGAQMFVLQILGAGGVMSVNELATLSCTHQSSVSVVVSRLVEGGFVKRSQSAVDGRRLELSLTASGRRLLESDLVTPQARMIASLGKLQPERLHALRSLLQEVITESGFETETAPMFFQSGSRSGAK